MLNALKKEFSIKKLKLNLDKDENFHESWVLSSWGFLLLRVCVCIFCVTIIILSGVQGPDSFWFIYLTNWSFLLLTATMIGLTALTIHRALQKKQHLRDPQEETYEVQNSQARITDYTGLSVPSEKQDSPMIAEVEFHSEKENSELARTWKGVGKQDSPVSANTKLAQTLEDDPSPSLSCYEKLVWFLWIISANAGLIVTIEYWLLVFRPPSSFLDISLHALNSVIILTELFTAKLPVCLVHWVYVTVFALIYLVFTIIYWVAGGLNSTGDPYIYHILDYENGEPEKVAAVIVASIFVVLPVVQFILYGCYKFRLWLNMKNSDGNGNSDDASLIA